MLFHSTIRKELARTFVATLVVLITVVISIMLIRVLGQAARGSINPQDVMMVMAYTVLGHMSTILTLSLFIAITSTLGRMYQDSEMVIWFASGRGLVGFLAPLFRFAWPILAVIFLLALVVWPWSLHQVQDLKDRFEQRGDIERVAPGQFQENALGNRVFFVEKDAGPGELGRNVFISALERGRQSITSARSGRIDLIGEDRFLKLSIGQRLESEVGHPDLKISEFESYATKIDANTALPTEDGPVQSQPTLTLLRKPVPSAQAELAWRLSLGLAALNLSLIALAVANVNPRAGRSGHLVFALLTFIVYYNLLNLGHGWITASKVSFANFMLWLHGGALLAGGLWLVKRHFGWSLSHLLRRQITAQRSPPPTSRAPLGTRGSTS
jgi:lipopolysaccharide export system permease protein